MINKSAQLCLITIERFEFQILVGSFETEQFFFISLNVFRFA